MKPTHVLKVLNKETDGRCNVGAGWQNPDGSISIQLNPCVTLQAGPELVINLFPVRSDEDQMHPKKQMKPEKKRGREAAVKDTDDGEEIPF